MQYCIFAARISETILQAPGNILHAPSEKKSNTESCLDPLNYLLPYPSGARKVRWQAAYIPVCSYASSLCSNWCAVCRLRRRHFKFSKPLDSGRYAACSKEVCKCLVKLGRILSYASALQTLSTGLLSVVQKKSQESINARLQLVMKSGKYTLGTKTVLKCLRSGKGERHCVACGSLQPLLDSGMCQPC